ALSDFFFQAEDGIRDWSVTGVQTCALPIFLGPRRKGTARRPLERRAAPRQAPLDAGREGPARQPLAAGRPGRLPRVPRRRSQSEIGRPACRAYGEIGGRAVCVDTKRQYAAS